MSTTAVVVTLSDREMARLEALQDAAEVPERERRDWLTARLETPVDLTVEVPAARELLHRFEVGGMSVKAEAAREVVSGFVRSLYGEKTSPGRRPGDGVIRSHDLGVRVPASTLARLDRDARALGLTRASLVRDRLLGLPLARVRQDLSVDAHVNLLERLIVLGEAVDEAA